jgi:predicted alpha-1,6-mannanase (GH76 family)
MKQVFALCLFILLLVAAASPTFYPAQNPAATNLADLTDKQLAAQGIQQLQSWYDQKTGLYRTTGWWNSANAITTLADYAQATGSRQFDPVFQNTFIAAQKTSAGFLNRFYDDEGWWALAWIDVYDITGLVSDQADESITLIPYAAAKLRITAFPQNAKS